MGNFGNFTLEIEEITVKNVPSGYVKRLKFENKKRCFFYWNNEDFTNERIGQPSRIEISPCKLDWEFIDANRFHNE
jgi:hypothetical protein